MKRYRRSKKGFTLIELVVVIAILAILAVIALPRLAGLQENANKKAVVANLKMIDNAIAVYSADNNVAATAVTQANLTTGSNILITTWPTGPKGVTYAIGTGAASATVPAGVPGIAAGTYSLAQALAFP